MELKLIFREVLSRIPDMRATGEAQILRSNFIGGIKHLPVEFTPGVRVNPGPLAVG
jgi:cytochrome P450